MKPPRVVVFLLLVTALLFSQTGKPRPRFEDYPVKIIYHRRPSPPVLNKEQRMFRTMIRMGAKGRVEFAGHYTVPRWGCGAGCSQLAIADSITGRVYDVPFSVSELSFKWEDQNTDPPPERMEFRANSRLMKFSGCLNERNCGFYDFVMVEGEGLRLLRQELLPNEFQ